MADILQIPLSVIFTRVMNLFAVVIPNMTGNIVGRLGFLSIAIVLTGIGIVLTLNVRMIPNPGDGIVQALSDIFDKKISTIKNVLDAICTSLSMLCMRCYCAKI